MTQSDVQDLICTDQLRKGKRLGMVVSTRGGMVEVLWDGDEEPTTYSKEATGESRTATIERRAPRTMRDGMTRGFFTRVFNG